MNKDKFFIGIGLAKTGSTWLYETFYLHPNVQMPPVKEIKYFYTKEYVGKANLFKNIFSKHWVFTDNRKQSLLLFKEAKQQIFQLKREGWKNLCWVSHYFCMPQNNCWYKRLFPKDKSSGDISPNYTNLSEDSIQKIKALNPNTKIIIGLRNPIERVWSFTMMHLVRRCGKKSILEVDKSEVIDFFNNKEVQDPNDYVELLTMWKRHFDEEQIFIYYFEELQANPQVLYNRICDFLQLTPMSVERINKVFNKGIVEEIPVEYEKILINMNYTNIEKFAKTYPNKYSLAWFERVTKNNNCI